MSAPVLLSATARGVVVRRRGRQFLGPVDLDLGGQGAAVILGPNGAGKTTLLRALHWLERLSEGSIDWSLPRDLALRLQAFVFQQPVMLRRTVRDNLAYPLTLAGTPRAEARARANDWAARVGLGDALDRRAYLLSGGEQQKLALARALIRAPRWLFLDEPTANLDGRATREIEEILRAALDRDTRIVMATHNLGQARRLADEVIFLYRGRVHERGPAGAFFDGPRTPEAQAFLQGDILE